MQTLEGIFTTTLPPPSRLFFFIKLDDALKCTTVWCSCVAVIVIEMSVKPKFHRPHQMIFIESGILFWWPNLHWIIYSQTLLYIYANIFVLASKMHRIFRMRRVFLDKDFYHGLDKCSRYLGYITITFQFEPNHFPLIAHNA